VLAGAVRGKIGITAVHILPAVRKPDPSLPDLPRRAPPPRPTTQNKKLANIVEHIWRHAGEPGTVGDGTTFDAIRNEVRTGRLTRGKKHDEKSEALSNGLRDLLKRRDLAPADRALVEDLQFMLLEAEEG